MHRTLLICVFTSTLLAQTRSEPGPQPAFGGEARLLISSAANDTRPMFSPDKKHLAFVSTRTGGGDVYVLTFATSDVRRLTFDDGAENLDGWSRDGKWIYFFSNAH